MDFRVEMLDDTNVKIWEEFNQKMDEGTFFHTMEWKRILESLGYVPYYFLVFAGDEPVAICPFFETNIKGFKGISILPRSDYKHMVIKDNNPHIINFIRNELESKAKEKSWAFILLNSLNNDFKNNFDASYLNFPSTGTMVLDLEKLNLDKIWNEVFSTKKKQRQHINRLKNDGFQIKEVDSLKDMEIFYELYIKSMRHINGSEFPYSHFKDLYDLYFPKKMLITLLHKEDIIAGGLLNFLDESRKTIHIRYLALNRDVSKSRYRPTTLLDWDLAERAFELGYKRICFGATPNDQNDFNYRYKKDFGCNYWNVYSILKPTSKLFKIGYSLYGSVRQGAAK